MSQAIDERSRHYAALYNLLFEVCKIKNIQIEISEAKLADAIVHFNRDIKKLDDHQGAQISANKRNAGLMFWVRRIKPITFACMVNSEKEIQDINEQAAVWISHRLMLTYAETSHAMPMLRTCHIPSKKAQLNAYLSAHWRMSNWFNYASLVYSLRYRNFSPHHLAILLDTLTTGFVLKHQS